eukprot:gene39023-45468_t
MAAKKKGKANSKAGRSAVAAKTAAAVAAVAAAWATATAYERYTTSKELAAAAADPSGGWAPPGADALRFDDGVCDVVRLSDLSQEEFDIKVGAATDMMKLGKGDGYTGMRLGEFLRVMSASRRIGRVRDDA